MDPTSPPSPDPAQPPTDDQPGAETVDPIEGLAVGADYYAEHAQPAVPEPGYAEHPPPGVRFVFRTLVDEVTDAWTGIAPGDLDVRIESRSADEVMLTVDPDHEAALFGWGKRMEETGGHPDWSFDYAAAASTVSGRPTVFVSAPPRRVVSEVRAPVDWGRPRFDPRPLESRLPWARLVELLRAQRAFVYRRPRSGQAELRNSTAEWFVEITEEEAQALDKVLAGSPALLQPPAPPSVWSTQTSDLAQRVSRSERATASMPPRSAAAQVRSSPSTASWMEAERLAQDVRRETGGSPEWAAVVAKLIDHLAPLSGSRTRVGSTPAAAPATPAPLLDKSHGAEPQSRETVVDVPSGLSNPRCPNLTMAGRQDRCGLFRSPPTCGETCGEPGEMDRTVRPERRPT